MRKRKGLMILVLILCVSLMVGCGGKDVTTSSGEEVIKLRVAGQDPEDHPNTIALNELAKRMEERTNGRIKMTIYPANQLGDYTSVYEEVMKGTIDMALINVPSQYNEKFEFTYLPYLATSYDHVPKIYGVGSVVGQEFAKLNAESNVKWLGFSMSGCIGIATSKELKDPVEFGADKGCMIRVPGMILFKNHMTDMGFRTVTIPYSDLFTALQTGTADGCVGTSPLDTYSTVRDVIKYYYLYNVSFDCMSYIMNMDKFNSLKAEEQQLLQDICAELSEKSIASAYERDEEYIKKMEDMGIKIVRFTPEELELFAEKTREKTWPSLESRYGADLINTLRKAVE